MAAQEKPERARRELLRVGKEKGFLTLDDLIYGGPESESDEEVDQLLSELDDYGIDVVGQEAEPEVQEPETEAEPEAPAFVDPVAMYMRQLRQVPLLSRRAEVDAAQRLEAGRLQACCAALSTGIVEEEMARLWRRMRERQLDPLDLPLAEGEPPPGEETVTVVSDPLEQLAQLKVLEQEHRADERELAAAHGLGDEERARRTAAIRQRRDRMLDLLHRVPYREALLRRVMARVRMLHLRLEEAREQLAGVVEATGLKLPELRRALRARRALARGPMDGGAPLPGGPPTVALSDEQARQLRNALRRVRAVERRAGAPAAEIERVHRQVVAADRKAQRAKDELVLANQRLVVHIAGRYINRGLPFLELVQEGNLGLMRAVEKFDHRRGYKFSTYGTWWIRHAISRAIANQTRTIRLPVHIRDAIRRLVTESQRHVMEFGREPTTDELAQRLKIAVERVVEIMEASRKTLRWELPVGEDGETELGTLISDREAPSPFEEVSNKGQWEQIVRAMDSLREREREVMRRRFGLDGRLPQTLEEVGRDLGITRERVRQIQARSIRKIQVAVRTANRLAAQQGRRRPATRG